MALLLVLRFSNVCLGLNDNISDSYPLTKGNYWIYQGKLKYEGKDGKVLEKSVTLKMEIFDVIKKGHLTFAIVKGHPSDLLVISHKYSSDNVIIRVGPSRYYLLDGDMMTDALKRVKDPKDNLGDLVQEEYQILDVPLIPGKVFGEADSITRQDLFFCWVVDEERKVNLDGIKGIAPSDKLKQYTLLYRCLASDTTVYFVPGIGITGYKYSHHGTIEELDVNLIETNIRRR